MRNGRDREALRRHMARIRPAQPAKKHGESLPVDPATLQAYEGRLLEASPHLAGPRYAIARDLLIRTLVRIDRIDAWYATAPRAWYIKSTASGKASMQPIEQRYAALLERAMKFCEALGLTPSSAKGLGLGDNGGDLLSRLRGQSSGEAR